MAPLPELTFFRALADERVRLDWVEIALALLTSLVIALLVSAGLNHKWLHLAARRMHVSRRSGSLDAWSYLFNSDEIGWVSVRDIPKDLVYEGWVDAFSDSSAAPEVLLKTSPSTGTHPASFFTARRGRTSSCGWTMS